MKETIEIKKLVTMYLKTRAIFQTQQAAELFPVWPNCTGFRVRDTRKDYGISLCIKGKLLGPGIFQGLSLHGILQRPVSEAVNVNPGLSRRLPDFKNARVMKYLQNKGTNEV